MLQEEKQTWQLVYSLFKDRLEEKAKDEMEEAMDIETALPSRVNFKATTWYPVIQKHIILDDITGLIENMYAWLQNDRENLSAHLVRLMAHLVLFLRSVQLTDGKEELCEAIVVTFVVDLINCKSNKNLVAFYVATLSRQAQIMWYAKFLEGIEGDERRQCLSWAEEEGLDVAAISKMVVETIRNRDSASALPSYSLVPDLTISETSRDRIYKVVLFPDGGWLVDASEESGADELRLHQMEQLRRIHMPALCLHLHTILHASQMYEEAVLMCKSLMWSFQKSINFSRCSTRSPFSIF